MKVLGVTNFSAKSNQHNISKPAFKGHWESRTTGAPYPYEGSTVSVEAYVADVDESFDEINRNFLSRAQGNRDMFRSYGDVYTIGGTNFFVDFSKNREYKKRSLTSSSEYYLKNKRWLDAVEDKLKIAGILEAQGPRMARDKFLTEEGIRSIFGMADKASRMKIIERLVDYNVDMAAELLKKIHA